MMRSLFSGVTGLRSHQTRMDVIGNNVANVNTTGYKKSVVTFKDLYSEKVSAAAGATGTGAGTTGGINAKQIGLGSAVGAISVVHSPGSSQYTGRSMDVAISGDGYFVVQTPSGLQYTRSGNFYTDTSGNLVTEAGYYVQVIQPLTSVVADYTLDQVDLTALANPASGVLEPSAGAIRSGNVTADLEAYGNMPLNFDYVNGGWSATTLVPTRNVTAPTGYTSSGTINMQAIAQAMQAAAQDPANNIKAGTLGVEIKQLDPVGAPNDVSLVVNGYTLATATVGADGTVDFGAYSTDLKFTSDSIDPAVLASGLKDKAIGSITLKEEGQWIISDASGLEVERVNVATSPTTTSIIGRGDEFQIVTQTFGTFRLRSDREVYNNQQLGEMLSDSVFALDVKQDNGLDYTAPNGVSKSDLGTLQIDTEKYSNISIDPAGAVIGQLNHDVITNADDGTEVTLKAGSKVVIGYLAISTFSNPSGLEKAADNMYIVSANSGDPNYGVPGVGNAGSLTPSNLEMSNVDLSEEMVNMIVTQRGFQANSRIITTTDTMLEELVNLKR